jgi:hypothetical protein
MTSGAPLFGSTLVFPRDPAERAAKGDPRRSIEERYGSLDAYLRKVQVAASDLVTQGLLLDEDVERCLQVAEAKWQAFHQ